MLFISCWHQFKCIYYPNFIRPSLTNVKLKIHQSIAFEQLCVRMLLLGMKNEVLRLTVSTDSPFSCSDICSGEASFSLLYSIQTAAEVKHAAVSS